MAETTGYEYDIFISYAHDDDPVLDANDGWVTQFHEQLYNWLTKLRGHKNLNIWFDKRKLDGNTRFDDAIKKGVQDSALFFVIHSGNYQKSQYCNQELDWFINYNEENRDGVMVGDESRLFNIQIQNLHHKQWSKKLAGTSGFTMHDAETDDDLGFPIYPSDGPDFRTNMRQVIRSVEKAIKTLSSKSSITDEDAPTPTPQIFIANVPESLEDFRNELIDDIKDKATIFKALPPPFEAREHQLHLEESINRASLSIHLLDELSGEKITGVDDGSTYPKVQADHARNLRKHSLIWIPKKLTINKIKEKNHAKWLNELENDNSQSRSFEFIRGTRQQLIDQVNQEIDKLCGIPSQAFGDRPNYLIDTHLKDVNHAILLGGKLAENGIKIGFNQEWDDPVKGLENFEEAVRKAHNLILIFGHVAPSWICGRINMAIKTVAHQLLSNTQKLDKIWVYMLPECPGKTALPKVPSLIKIDCLENSSTAQIDDAVIQRLLNSQGRI